MSLAITIVTTANRTRRFFQTDPERVAAILDSLKRSSQLFTASSQMIVSEDATELFSPKAIARIEFHTQIDLAPYLPPAWNALDIKALDPETFSAGGFLDEAGVSSRVDFFFAGGDTLAAWIEGEHRGGVTERTTRMAHIFESPVIPYAPVMPGIGLMNPVVMTRIRIAAGLLHPPAGAWYANEA